MTLKIYYHFTGDKLRDGRDIPPIGEWLIHDGKVAMCESGLHASPTAFQALQYAPGSLLHRVYLGGDLQHDDSKSVGCKRQIIATIDAEILMCKFARIVALKVAYLWDMPTVVREYLETGDGSKRDAAHDAAWDAAQDAAQDAARAAARAAAWAAARAAAWDAAWVAAWAAAWSATWAAAWAAAWDAVWDAARAAARNEYAAIFNAMVDEAFTTQETK